jgi:putative oxidoreductase
MIMSHSASLTQTSPVRYSRPGRIALWTVQIALAGMFLLAGGSKLVGTPPMVALFDAVGIGQWFRYVTGLIEVGSGFALLVPALAVFGALALVPTMIGAIVTQLFIVRASPVPPAILLVGVAVVVWARRHELHIPIGKHTAR